MEHRPSVAEVADVSQLDLSPRQFRTRFGGLFLFVPLLAEIPLDDILKRAGFPGSNPGAPGPAGAALRSLLGLKLFGNARHSHVMSHVFDEGSRRAGNGQQSLSFTGLPGGQRL